MEYLYQLQCLREALPDFIDYLFVFISEFAIYVGPAIPIVIFICVDKKIGSRILMTLAFSDLLVNFVKIVACVNRPWIRDDRLYLAEAAKKSATGYSFPSGHTSTATTIYGGLAVWQKKRKGLVAFLIIMILLTAFARNFLGAHTLLDVSVSICFGIFSTFLIPCIERWVEKAKNNDIIFALIILIISICILVFATFKSYPMEYLADGSLLVDPIKTRKDVYASVGMLLGVIFAWIGDRRWIHYKIPSKKNTKIIVGVLAVIIFAIVYLGLGEVFTSVCGYALGSFLKRFVTVVAAMLIYPLVLSKLIKN